MPETVIRLTNVSKSFAGTPAVANLDLSVPGGCIYGLLGPNGAGKTTTIRIILDIVGPDSGTVEVFGERCTDETRTRIGYLPEERGLYQKMRVAEHLAFLGELKHLRHSEAMRRARYWLDRLGLGDRADDKVETFSKGMQQKVQFAATVMAEPELLILDEPFSGLDPINVDLFREIILERRRAGTAVLFSTHLIEDAEKLCDRVCMIAGARKVLDGTMAEVKAGTGSQSVAIESEGPRAFLEAPDLIDGLTDLGRVVEVRLKPGADPQVLLRRAVEDGARIRRFELVEPSLRQIFLDRAGAAGANGSASASRPEGEQ
ncbi:MAG: ATP-binding cassette domain-containing protein [Gemmatimonadota bacterium]